MTMLTLLKLTIENSFAKINLVYTLPPHDHYTNQPIIHVCITRNNLLVGNYWESSLL